MAGHAGFAVAATVKAALIEQMLAIELSRINPTAEQFIIPLPDIQPISQNRRVRLSGVLVFDRRPKIILATNAGNTVGVDATVVGYLSAALEQNGVPEIEQTWRMRVTARADGAFSARVDPDGVFGYWEGARSAVTSLSITTDGGAPVPAFLVEALNSAFLRNALNTIIRAIPQTRVTPRLHSGNMQHTQPGYFPDSNFSVFEWFTINLRASRVELRIRNGCLCVGVDLQGISNGNADGLNDLFLPESGARFGYKHRISNGAVFMNKGPLFGGDVAILLNFNVITAVISDVSRQIANTPIHPQIKLQGVKAAYSTYQRDLQTTHEKALHIEVDLSRGLTCHAYLPVYQHLAYRKHGDGTETQHLVWSFGIGRVDIDLPFWITAAVILGGMLAAMILPLLATVITVGQIAVLDGILPSLVDGTKRQVQKTGGAELADSVVSVPTDTPLGRMSAYRGVTCAYLAPEGLYVSYTDSIAAFRSAEDPMIRDLATLETRLFAGSIQGYSFRLQLGERWRALENNCRIAWEIRRADTNAVVLRQTGAYNDASTVSLDHLNPGLYFVDEYRVSVKLYLNRLTQQGLLFSHAATVRVEDTLDRHQPYVTWGKHEAHFRAPNKVDWWHRMAHPAIHRTATSARCLVIRGKGDEGSPGLVYFGRNKLQERREQRKQRLCPYCFRGGPSNSVAYPDQDWFKK